MARPAKSLKERVRDRSFLARRHAGLLAGPLADHPELRDIQVAYQAAETDRQRRLLALDFEQNVRTARPGKRVGGLRLGELAPADFFPRNLAHVKGPAAGQAFKLEPWQRRFVEQFTRTNRIYGSVLRQDWSL